MVTQFMDKEIFCAHILEHESAMYRAARSILNNPEDVEDAVQEAICAAFAHRGDLCETHSALSRGCCGS